jgi:LysM repeat protein
MKDMDDFRGPSRRPWLFLALVLLLVVAGVCLRCCRPGHPRETVEPPGEQGAAVAAPAVAAPGGQAAAAQAPGTTNAAAVRSAPAAPRADLQQALAEARQHADADRLLDARKTCLSLLGRPDAAALRGPVEELLGDVNLRLVLSPRAMPEKIEYATQSGDSLKVLARRFGVTQELIQRGNNIANPNRIQSGDRLRILSKPAFEIAIGKQANDLVLRLNGAFFKRYRVGTGQYGRTPAGTFRIKDKIENPPWWHPDGREIPFGDPANILGTRWMSIEATGATPPARGYGIHGTWDDNSIGRQSSAGCIRMHNADVEELFALVPEGTPVKIAD